MIKKQLFLLLLSAIVCNGYAQDSASFYYKNYEFAKAIEFEKKNEQKDYVLLAKSYHKLGQIDDAKINYIKAFEEDTTNIRVLNSIADFHKQLGEYSNAIDAYGRLIDLQPENAYYFKKLGSLLVKIDRYHYASKALEAAIELNENDLESKLLLVDVLLQKKQINRADILLKNNLQEYPENKAFIKQAIKIAYKLRDYEDVVAKSERFYSVADSGLVIQKVDGIARYHLKRYEEATALLTNVSEVDTESEVVHYYLGLCYREMGQEKEAAKYLEKAIELGITENIENYYVQLAVVYEEMKAYDKSIQLYKAAYAKSKDKILLYHLARNYDEYYKDKSTALKYYELYLAENDTANESYFDFSKSRVHELKVAKHFDIDTLN